MIYLIDDKINRQKDYGWNQDQFMSYKNDVIVIHKFSEIEDNNLSDKIFQEGNILLFHESFFEHPDNRNKKSALEIRNKIHKFSRENIKFRVVYFSGSKKTRLTSKNETHLPVDVFYKNLSFFLDTKDSEYDMSYLLFGKNPEIEEKTKNNIKKHEGSFIKLGNISLDDFLIFRGKDDIKFKHYVNGSDVETIFLDEKYDNQVTDEYLHDTFTSNTKKYKGICIPLCFGNTLSDFNGLRTALHIRCSNIINKLTPIIIYGNNSLSDVINNPYFDVLKMEGIHYIDYSHQGFSSLKNINFKDLNNDKLIKELSKINLLLEKHYDSNHSVANEWGIFQMARNAGIDINEITGFDESKMKSIYFKWLIAKNNLYEKISEKQEEELKQYAEKLPGLKVLGKIDLRFR